jgi:DUF1680 family protein
MDRAERFTLALRVPTWAGKQTILRVNGKATAAVVQPGSWAEIDREWKDGDHVEFSIDMPLRLVPLDAQHANVVALLHGPVALFAIEPGSKTVTQKQLLQAQRVGASSADWQIATDQGQVVLKPYPAITTEHYRLYQET